MKRVTLFICLTLLLLMFSVVTMSCQKAQEVKYPNILICIADDAGHMGKEYPWLDTPAFDRIERGCRTSVDVNTSSRV